MERIHPLTEAKISSYIGRPVCAVMSDGSYYYGTLKGVRNGHIVLGNQTPNANTRGAKTNKSKKRAKKGGGGSKSKTSAYGYGAGILLPLTFLTLLYAFPRGYGFGYPFFI